MARIVLLFGMCAVVIAGGHANAAAAGAAAAIVAVPAAPARPQAPQITGGTDGKRAWMTATYRGLTVRKLSSRADRTVSLDFRLDTDALSIVIDAQRVVTVTRGGRSVVLSSESALAEVQELLGGSAAVFGARALLSARESTADLEAPEMSLLSATAFLASIVGDTEAPRRLSSRFVERHRGIIRPVRFRRTCWDTYTSETTAAWDDLQACMAEADQDESFWSGAYRRLACNAVWLGESESAWFEYLNCLSPLSIAQ